MPVFVGKPEVDPWLRRAYSSDAAIQHNDCDKSMKLVNAVSTAFGLGQSRLPKPWLLFRFRY
jgi:hypothetical protein